MKNNFIRTTDADTAAQLRKLGFEEIMSGQQNVFMFVNKAYATFEKVDKTKINYTNNLCI